MNVCAARLLSGIRYEKLPPHEPVLWTEEEYRKMRGLPLISANAPKLSNGNLKCKHCGSLYAE